MYENKLLFIKEKEFVRSEGFYDMKAQDLLLFQKCVRRMKGSNVKESKAKFSKKQQIFGLNLNIDNKARVSLVPKLAKENFPFLLSF